ncbi:MAG: hypothetical protein Q9226_004767 [Calogaya cf. arnoldii]
MYAAYPILLATTFALQANAAPGKPTPPPSQTPGMHPRTAPPNYPAISTHPTPLQRPKKN